MLKNNFSSPFKRDIGLKSLMLFGFELPDFKTRPKQTKQMIPNTGTQFILYTL